MVGNDHVWKPLLGAIVLWWGEGRVTANFEGVDVVPLQGAIVVCYGGEGRVTTNFGGVDVVPLLGAFATTSFGGVDVVSLLGAVDVVPLLGAIVGCHCSVLWLGRATLRTWCHCWVPWQGAMTMYYSGCHCRGHCSMVWWRKGDGQFWGSGRGAIAGGHCRVPFVCAMVGRGG